MPSNRSTSCEVSIDGRWKALGLDEAQSKHRDARKRCPACHGAVNIAGSYGYAGTRLSLAHRRLHDGCPLRPDSFSGKRSLHPQAIA